MGKILENISELIRGLDTNVWDGNVERENFKWDIGCAKDAQQGSQHIIRIRAWKRKQETEVAVFWQNTSVRI
jgi:hypothetical protein